MSNVPTGYVPQPEPEILQRIYGLPVLQSGKAGRTIGLLTNSAGKVVRLLKGFVNYQVAKGVIPMIDYVSEILKKYNYDLPKIPSYTFNERVKELGERSRLKQKIEVVRKKGKNREKKIFEK